MLLRDPPDHTRLRRLVTNAFTTRAVERLRPQIERITDELLDGIEAGAADGAVDLMEFFGARLPMRVIGSCWALPGPTARSSGPQLTRFSPQPTPTNYARPWAL